MAFPWPDDSIFEPFDVSEVTYKVHSSHEIKSAILVPKNLNPGLHPVIVNFHGGFLATAHSLFAPFFPTWALKLAIEQNAIIISPDYRLLPNAKGVGDILEDLEDFWTWFKSDLPQVVKENSPGHILDFSRVLVSGGSAGGYCAIQVALSHPDEIAAVAVVYPFVDANDKIFTDGPTAEEPTIMRNPREDILSKEETIDWINESRKTVTTKAGFDRTPYCVAATQHGLFTSEIYDNLGLNSPEFSPLSRISAGAKLPKAIWLMHGDDDSVVLIRASYKFVELLKMKLPDTVVRFDIVPGQDHAFDIAESTWESFRAEALGFVTKQWLEV
ncbi:hypothetical protein G7046_g2934 [Stylonectria norvegica]|nr:hypothetical protein G7046_g2934 [Stylonectria norvegica]